MPSRVWYRQLSNARPAAYFNHRDTVSRWSPSPSGLAPGRCPEPDSIAKLLCLISKLIKSFPRLAAEDIDPAVVRHPADHVIEFVRLSAVLTSLGTEDAWKRLCFREDR